MPVVRLALLADKQQLVVVLPHKSANQESGYPIQCTWVQHQNRLKPVDRECPDPSMHGLAVSVDQQITVLLVTGQVHLYYVCRIELGEIGFCIAALVMGVDVNVVDIQQQFNISLCGNVVEKLWLCHFAATISQVSRDVFQGKGALQVVLNHARTNSNVGSNSLG